MQSTQDPLISVVIVSYNVKDFLTECLSSVEKFIEAPHEIIVVDNASADGTVESVRSSFPNVTLIESKKNLGFSAGNNLGFAGARGRYLLMLNPDAALIDTSISEAILYMEKAGTSAVLVGPRILNPDRSYQASAWKFPKLRQLFLESIFISKLADLTSYAGIENSTKESEVDFVSGAAILMKKETCLSLQGLDEGLFWMDDVDLCYRNKLAGGTTIYFPSWKLTHHIGQSSKKNPGIVISNQLISKLKFFRKHGMGLKYLLAVFILAGHIKIRLVLLGFLSIGMPAARIKLNAYWFALKKFLRYLFKKENGIT